MRLHSRGQCGSEGRSYYVASQPSNCVCGSPELVILFVVCFPTLRRYLGVSYSARDLAALQEQGRRQRGGARAGYTGGAMDLEYDIEAGLPLGLPIDGLLCINDNIVMGAGP